MVRRLVAPSIPAAVILFSVALAGQRPGENQYLADTPGTAAVAISLGNRAAHGLTAAEASAFQHRLERLRDLLLAQPVFHPLLGATVKGGFQLDDSPAGVRGAPVPAHGRLWYHSAVLFPKSDKPAFMVDTSDEVLVSINNPTRGLATISGLPGGARFFYEPRRAGEMNGFPLFRGELDCEYIVLSRDGKVPWAPVTREEYARVWLESWQKRAAASTYDTVSPRIAARQAEMLAAMSPEERRMPARHFRNADPFAPPLAPPGSSLGNALVKAGTDWFDPSLPRTAVQTIVVKFWYSGALNPDRPGPASDGHMSAVRVWETLHKSDWKQISAVLKTGTPTPTERE